MTTDIKKRLDFIKRIIHLHSFRRISTRRFYIFLVSLIVISGLFVQYLYASLYGVPPGYTGAPFDGVTCATAGCHPGPPKEVQGWITSDVPLTGYIPGDTYNITLTASRPNTAKFGFQVTAQSDAGSEGYFIVVDSIGTQHANDVRYVTHTLDGASGNNQKTWQMKWVSPLQAGWDPVSVYASFVAGVYNQNDEVYISKLTFALNQSAGNLSENPGHPVVYPNPFNTILTLLWPYPDDPVINASVISIQGKQVFSTSGPPPAGDVSYSFYTGPVPAGIYFLDVRSKDQRFIEKVVRVEK